MMASWTPRDSVKRLRPDKERNQCRTPVAMSKEAGSFYRFASGERRRLESALPVRCIVGQSQYSNP